MIITKTCARELSHLRRRLERKLERERLDRLECAMLDFVNDLFGRAEVALWSK